MSYAGDITPQQAWDLLNGDPAAVLVDVRTSAEWRFVGVPDLSGLGRDVVYLEWVDATGTPNPDFARDLVNQVAGGPVVFLCRSGNRSIPAAETATAAGLTPAYNVLDGFEGNLDEHGHRGGTGWRAVGLPWRQS
ncbi:MAG TPA: rhodanese-like domain-containing protein [Mycobacterium sp.]|nr:rhodanese-like domain-containing protein [Mycobacterium sp.]